MKNSLELVNDVIFHLAKNKNKKNAVPVETPTKPKPGITPGTIPGTTPSKTPSKAPRVLPMPKPKNVIKNY